MRQTEFARNWAIATLNEVAELANRKTALKNARTTIGSDALVDECVLVARRKRDAYATARYGFHSTSQNWVSRDPELARAIHVLGACGLPVNDIPMMPDEA